MGNVAVIKKGDVQVMSAGTGIYHSEFNKNTDKQVKFIQIWMSPNKRAVEPRYDQVSLKEIQKDNAFFQVLSPNKEDQGVWVNQNAWFHIGKFTKGNSDIYTIKSTGNGVYAFVLEGKVNINNQDLSNRDGMGIWNTESVVVKATTDARVLLMDVPMTL
jgi:redox-sensitive bicupin YhaK (pirin superfamily)